MYYIGNKGNYYYIISEATNEAGIFNMFGELQTTTTCRDALIDLFNKKVEVDLLSIVGTKGKRKSDIYFNGYRAPLNSTYLDVVAIVQANLKTYKQNNIMYQINEVGYNQIIIVFRKNMLNLPHLAKLMGLKESSFKKIN